MRHKQIITIINSNITDYEKYDSIIKLLCGRPIYEVELLSLKKGNGCIVKRKSFNSLKELLIYKEKLQKRKYPIYEASVHIGYYSNEGKCYFR